MLENKRIMTVLAHPDDETLGCGGTLHRFRKQAIRCCIPVLRIQEQLDDALPILGVKKYFYGNFEDNMLDAYPLMDVCKFVAKYVNFFKPNVIITHCQNCTNQDHRVLYEACIIATRPMGEHISLLTCEIPSSTGYLRPTAFEPNLYVELSKSDIKAKMNAVEAYHTEFKNCRSPEVVEALAKVRGAESGFKYAEGFMLVRSYL